MENSHHFFIASFLHVHDKSVLTLNLFQYNTLKRRAFFLIQPYAKMINLYSILVYTVRLNVADFCLILIFSDSVSDTRQRCQNQSVTMAFHIPPLHSHLQPRSLKCKIQHVVGEKWNRWRVHRNVEGKKVPKINHKITAAAG